MSDEVVVLDIDGTLGDYHAHFLEFAQGWLGKEMPAATDINPGQPLHKHMCVSKARYRECKLAFRRGGLKRSMPHFEGARELAVDLRKAKVKVWLATTRPYLAHDNIDQDTMEWLRRNRIQYDDLLWGQHKYVNVMRKARQAGKRVMAGLDDLPEMIWKAHEQEVPTFIMDAPYNREALLPQATMRVRGLGEATDDIIHLIKEDRG